MKHLVRCLLVIALVGPVSGLLDNAVAQSVPPLPPTSLESRLAEYREMQARIEAQRAKVQQSRLRRLTGSGKAAGASKATAPNTGAGQIDAQMLRQAARGVLAGLAAAVAVSAASEEGSEVAAISGGTANATTSTSGISTSTASTSSTSGTN